MSTAAQPTTPAKTDRSSRAPTADQPDGGDAEQGGGAELRLDSVTKRFGPFTAVDDLDLTVPAGSFFALLGPSGCGKTTTLRMVAGLEEPTSGTIRLGEQDISHLRPYKRPVNTVFQSYALFPHLTVLDNVAFGLKRRGRRKVDTEVQQMLELVELTDQAHKKPGLLSGGQQQRVALARALINQPAVLLLDEPLGALDLKLRRQMQVELKRIQTEVGLTFVHVTHDQEEAMTMADTVAVMNAGIIEQMGPPAELYHNPSTTFVANFLGKSNLVDGRVRSRDGDTVVVDVQGVQVRLPASRAAHVSGDRVSVGVRPEKVSLDEPPTGDTNRLPGGRISDVSFTGVSTEYLVAMPWGQELTVFEQNVGAGPVRHTGDEVDLHWRAEHTCCLDAAQDPEAGAGFGHGAEQTAERRA